jgi:invasion protein IalB
MQKTKQLHSDNFFYSAFMSTRRVGELSANIWQLLRLESFVVCDYIRDNREHDSMYKTISAICLLLVVLFCSGSRADTIGVNQSSQPADDLAARVKVGTNPDWVTKCVGVSRKSPLECTMEETLVLTNTGQLVAAVAIRISGDAQKPTMLVRVPVGLNLLAGVNVEIDGSKPAPVALKTCDVQGCFGETELDPTFVAILKRGKQLTLTFKNLANRNISLTLPLANFADAFQKIQ